MIREHIDSELEVVAGGHGRRVVVKGNTFNQGNTVTVGSVSFANGDDNSSVSISGGVNGGSNSISIGG
jgi:hypothetical protein